MLTGRNRSAAPTKRLPKHIHLGRAGEQAAALFLQRKGFTVIETNWRQGRLELDLICCHGAELVFVEVKTRSSRNFGGPSGSVTPAKMRNLSRAAQAWLAAHNAWQRPCRFDVVCLISN
ncbi:MAG: YraN family protein, partial [Desulfovibrionaceae bacterium]|nr:YraN family protein [Desulfovibrionaceae bacterium]